jgi:hypothetical protein
MASHGTKRSTAEAAAAAGGAADGGGRAVAAAAAPLADGAMVWVWSKAFSRYCSVALDGSMLCISAQESQAPRNLFCLDLHPLAA